MHIVVTLRDLVALGLIAVAIVLAGIYFLCLWISELSHKGKRR